MSPMCWVSRRIVGPDRLPGAPLTDVMQGYYLLQIFWKGDPGVENFVIKFPNQELRDKWYSMVERQRSIYPKGSKETGTSQIAFTSMSKTNIPNPYKQQEEEFDDEPIVPVDTKVSSSTTLVNPPSEYSSRHPSNSSLRSRSTTAGNAATPNSMARGLPHYPGGEADQFMPPPLKLSTAIPSAHPTPDERMGGSYFSPTDSPSSQRSLQGSAYPFPRQTQQAAAAWPVDGNKHATAPPMGRPQMSENHAYHPQRPAMSTMAQHRLRSMSSPDVNNQQHPARRYANGPGSPPVEDVPVPPIPPQLASMRAPVNRSQNNSPTDGFRSAQNGAQAANSVYGPHSARGPAYTAYNPSRAYATPPIPSTLSPGPPSTTPTPRMMSPPLQSPSPAQGDSRLPSQLKVKIHYLPEPSYVTLVVPIIIKHRTLIDRIDSKMEKARTSSIAKGTARLRYYDMEGDIITITNDEDVQLAIEEWAAANADALTESSTFNVPDFDLYWHDQLDNANAKQRS